MPRVSEGPGRAKRGAAEPVTPLALRWRAELADHVVALDWSPDGRCVAAAAASGELAVLDAAGGERLRTLPAHAPGVEALAWSPDGRLLASGGHDGMARLWDEGGERAALPGGGAWVERLAWQPDEGRLATSSGRQLRLWDGQGRRLLEYPPHPATIADIAWDPAGVALASATYGFLSLWGTEAPRPLRQLPWKGSMLALAWSPDGRYIATGNQDSTVHFWVLESEQDLQMYGYELKVRELAWDPTGRYLATGGGPAVTVWDTSGKGPAGTRPAQLAAHRGRVSALGYQRRGPLLASGGAEGDVVVWRVAGRAGAMSAIYALGAEVTRLAWSPDDRALAVGDAAGRVALFAVGSE